MTATTAPATTVVNWAGGWNITKDVNSDIHHVVSTDVENLTIWSGNGYEAARCALVQRIAQDLMIPDPTFVPMVHNYTERDKYGRSAAVFEVMCSRVAIVTTMPKRWRDAYPAEKYMVSDLSSDDRSEFNNRYFAKRADALAHAEQIAATYAANYSASEAAK